MKNHFLLNSVCWWCPLGNLLDVSGEVLILLILSPWGWGAGHDMGSHSYAPWSSCKQKLCLQFLCNIRYGFLSSNKSMEPCPRRREWPLPGQGLQAAQFLKDLLPQLSSTCYRQQLKEGFSDATPETCTGALRRDCFSNRIAQLFSVNLLYTKEQFQCITAITEHVIPPMKDLPETCVSLSLSLSSWQMPLSCGISSPRWTW